jgi:hypothetical protein
MDVAFVRVVHGAVVAVKGVAAADNSYDKYEELKENLQLGDTIYYADGEK